MKYDKVITDGANLVINGRKIIPSGDIAACSYIKNAIHLTKRDEIKDDMPRCGILALELARPYRQPSGFFMPMSKSIILRLAPDEECPEVPDASRLSREGAAHVRYLQDDGRLQIDSGIVEAKIKMNDYARAATTGTNAYGKPGLVSPVADITVYPREQRANIRYLGTTSRMFRSRYYGEHANIDFDLKTADNTRFTVIQAIAGTEAVAEYEVRRIERDEAGSGIWYLKLTKACASCVEAVSWLLALREPNVAGPERRRQL